MEPLKPSEVAKQLGFSKRTIINWYHDKVFPNAFQVKRDIRIPVSDVENLKNNLQSQKESA